MAWSDDFTSFPSSDWGLYDGPGHAGNGVRSPEAFAAVNGILTVTGTADGTTGGMSRRSQQRYGKWEARVRTPAGCACYHPVLLLWGAEGSWPEAGEIDYMENWKDAARQTVHTVVHYSADNRSVGAANAVDMTQWHTYTVEWTPDYIASYVDGQRYFYSTDRAIQPPGQVEADVQLDWFPGEVAAADRTGATMQIDWIRQYSYVAG